MESVIHCFLDWVQSAGDLAYLEFGLGTQWCHFGNKQILIPSWWADLRLINVIGICLFLLIKLHKLLLHISQLLCYNNIHISLLNSRPIHLLKSILQNLNLILLALDIINQQLKPLRIVVFINHFAQSLSLFILYSFQRQHFHRQLLLLIFCGLKLQHQIINSRLISSYTQLKLELLKFTLHHFNLCFETFDLNLFQL